MDYVNGVVEEQLHNHEARRAKREADRCVSTPDAAPRQPVLVMQDSKEDAGLPPQMDAVADAPDPVPATDSLPPRPKGMLDGDYRRMLQAFRNQKAVERDNAAMKERGRLH
jgi:hypothetical protein